MYNVFVILFTIVIEIIIYCAIPTIIRLIRNKPFSNKMAWYLSIVNFGLVFTTLRLVESKLLNVDYNSISADLFSGVLSLINVYILKYTKDNSKSFFKSIKEDYKKILKMFVIGFITLFAIYLVFSLIWKLTRNKIDDVWNNSDNTTTNTNITTKDIDNKVELKEINSQNEFKKIISSKEYTLVFFTQPNCIFCEKALPVVETFAKDHELTNMYNYEYNNSFDVGFDIDGFPTMAIYKDGKFIAQKMGYSDNADETSYRLSLAGFLREYKIME